MSGRSQVRQGEMALVYKGSGDYDVTSGAITLELSYDDASDFAVGDWTLWNVRIGDQTFGGTQTLGPGPFTDWLEKNARGPNGQLPDEPED